MRTAPLLAALLAATPAAAAEGPIPVASPISLTASDGTGLELTALIARAVVEAPLAFTELHLTFQNPQHRTIEGQFRITLPAGATVSRFAMRQGDRWQEGEVVELQAARRAYEDFLHRRQDPALLEQAAGNEFSARVFPIPARGVKELILSYSQELPGSSAPYVLPLKGLPKLGTLDVKALGGAGGPATLQRKAFVPDRDFHAQQAKGPSALRGGAAFVARVQPVASAAPEAIASLLLLVDTSASRALGFSAQARQVGELVQALAASRPQAPVTVAAFDQDVEVIYEGEARGFGARELERFRARRALGATDLEGALRWAAKAAGRSPRKRVLLVTDGVATAGATTGDALRVLVKDLGAAGVERLDALAVGGIRDETMLRRLATAGLARDGAVLDGELGVKAVLARLEQATRSGIAVSVPGARWVFPARLDGVQPGDELLIWAELPQAHPAQVLLDGKAVALGPVGSSAGPLLARSWVRAQIARLLDEEDRVGTQPKARAEIRQQIVELSVKHRVLSPYTALLVLETEADYARFRIPRNALADILTVGAQGVELLHRSAPVVAPPPERVVRDEAKLAKKKSKDVDGKLANGAAPPADGPALQPAKPSPPDAKPAEAPASGDREAKKELAEESKLDAVSSIEAADPSPGGAPAAPAPTPAPPPAAARPAPPAASEPDDLGGVEAELSAPRSETRTAGRRVDRRPGGRPTSRPAPRPRPPPAQPPKPTARPYEGPFAAVMQLVEKGRAREAVTAATAWREEHPGDVMALVGLGEACEAASDLPRAARAYGSIVDLFPARADLRRFAGERLERLANGLGLALAVDSFAKAVEQRPDHPASHRLLAYALLRAGHPAKAFEAIAAGATRRYPEGRFRGVDRILREDVGLVAAAWLRAEPKRAEEIRAAVARAGGTIEDRPSLRFILNWETDANDVDFHIYDGKGGHAYYSSPVLPSGGELYADVTTGYGPECFTIRSPRGSRPYPYTLQAHYYSRGPMGYGMGKLEVVEHDGQGNLTFEERPFVVMVDGAFVDLGVVKR